jgi:glycosyltransferase involved in cell wall biosynthesis
MYRKDSGDMTTRDAVSVIIPVYNEAANIADLVSRLRTLYPEFQILVVDDGSTDGTGDVAATAGADLVRHPYNMGNGAAVKSGIRRATGRVLVFMDGDGQHDPEDVRVLLDAIGTYDMVVGARSAADHASVGRAVGNRVYNWLASYVAKFPVRDLTSGFRAIHADLARKLLYLLPSTYSYPTTLTLAVLRSGRSLKYLPIRTRRRREGKSKIRLFRDGVRFFMIITKICTLYSPLRIFLPVSLLMFVLGASYYGYTFLTWRRFTNMSALLLSTSLIIFLMGLVSEQIAQMRYDRSEDE